MAITIPTVDEFTESTVMLVIREIAEYICGDNGLVAQINNNDITGFTSSYTNDVLKIDATKGDGSTIPVCNVTIEGGGSSTGNPYPTAVSGTVGGDGNITFTITMSSGSPLTTTINMNYFASADDLSDLQEQVSGIKPIITVNDAVSPPTITVAVNGKSSTANLPAVAGDNWEIVDLSNIPSNFQIGDEIEITFLSPGGYFNQNGSDWSSPPSIDKSNNIPFEMMPVSHFKLRTNQGQRETLITPIAISPGIAITILCYMAPSISGLNNGNLGNFYCLAFTGGGYDEQRMAITSSNVTSYIAQLRVKRA